MPSSTLPASRRTQPKGDKRARTRRKLLEAARELVREKGYAHTTMQDVAQRAGMTSGAIYGNFKNRDELFIALADEYWGPIQAKFEPNSSFAEKMQALARATLDAVPERSAAAVGALTGRAHALTHPEVLDRVRELTARAYADGATWLSQVAQPHELPMSPDLMVRVVHALTDGLLFQRILTPELVPDEVFHAAFGLLAVKPDLT
jgi:AcrR family transcriptional regulator